VQKRAFEGGRCLSELKVCGVASKAYGTEHRAKLEHELHCHARCPQVFARLRLPASMKPVLDGMLLLIAVPKGILVWG
jgi:hypothetical protein